MNIKKATTYEMAVNLLKNISKSSLIGVIGGLGLVACDADEKKTVQAEKKIAQAFPKSLTIPKLEIKERNPRVPPVLSVGSVAPDFNLLGVDGKVHKLGDYKKSKVLAVVFTTNHCPSAQIYEERIKQLVEHYSDKNFQLIAINGNNPLAVRLDEERFSEYGDSYEEMKLVAKERKFNFPYLYDGKTQDVTYAYGARSTPHIFIFDRERKLQYQGRIDSNENPRKVKGREAKIAIDALLADKPVAVPNTRAIGCSTKWLFKKAKVDEANKKWKALPVSLDSINAKGVKKLLKSSKNYQLINIWRTTCPACVEKFPKLIDLGRIYQHRNFRYITISLDPIEVKAEIKKLLQKHHAAMPPKSQKYFELHSNNLIYGGEDLEDFAKVLDKTWSGELPYLVLVSPKGKVIARWSGEASITEVRKVIVSHLGRHWIKS